MNHDYRPAVVKLLFIGESPPASGRCFYQQNSGLYRALREAFGADDEDFLARFQAAGCYLIDLCPRPVDRLPPARRRALCRQSEPALAQAIADLQPEMLITVVRSIEPNVARATAAYRGPQLHLPYPGRWSRFRRLFVAQLAPVIAARLTLPPPGSTHETPPRPARLPPANRSPGAYCPPGSH